MTMDELCAYITEDRSPLFATQLLEWAKDSARFRAFAQQYRDKLRKKLRGQRNEEGVRDLLTELAAAQLLLRDRRFTLEYETYSAEKQHGPDYRVSFRTQVAFNLEVTRVRNAPRDKRELAARCSEEVCEKLRQMPASIANVLYLSIESAPGLKLDLEAAMRRFIAAYHRKDDAFFTRRGLAGAADFLRYYHRLSGILVPAAGLATPPLWLNPLAKHPLPNDLRLALLTLL